MTLKRLLSDKPSKSITRETVINGFVMERDLLHGQLRSKMKKHLEKCASLMYGVGRDFVDVGALKNKITSFCDMK